MARAPAARPSATPAEALIADGGRPVGQAAPRNTEMPRSVLPAPHVLRSKLPRRRRNGIAGASSKARVIRSVPVTAQAAETAGASGANSVSVTTV